MASRTKNIIYILLGLITVIIFFLVFIYSPKSVEKLDRIQVVTSLYPLYFFSQQIGGDKADIYNIVPAGAEPHDYEPSARDMIKIENSQLTILIGRGLEGWGNDIQKNINPAKTSILVVGEGLDTMQVTEDGRTETDPHIWLSPLLAQTMIDKITTAFIQVDSLNKDYYVANSNILKAKLNALDLEYKQVLSSCREKNIITSHAAFAYLATRYGFNQVAIAGLSPDAEPSSQQLTDIVKFAKSNNIKYIFFESLVSPKLSETIANEVGAQALILDPIEGVSNQDLAQGRNYFNVMQDNLINLKIALQCSK